MTDKKALYACRKIRDILGLPRDATFQDLVDAVRKLVDEGSGLHAETDVLVIGRRGKKKAGV